MTNPVYIETDSDSAVCTFDYERYPFENETYSSSLQSQLGCYPNMLQSYEKPWDIERVKQLIESYASELLLLRFVEHHAHSSDQFGPVNITAIKPDRISSKHVRKLQKLKDIRDLSDQLHFNDGLTD